MKHIMRINSADGGKDSTSSAGRRRWFPLPDNRNDSAAVTKIVRSRHPKSPLGERTTARVAIPTPRAARATLFSSVDSPDPPEAAPLHLPSEANPVAGRQPHLRFH